MPLAPRSAVCELTRVSASRGWHRPRTAAQLSAGHGPVRQTQHRHADICWRHRRRTRAAVQPARRCVKYGWLESASSCRPPVARRASKQSRTPQIYRVCNVCQPLQRRTWQSSRAGHSEAGKRAGLLTAAATVRICISSRSLPALQCIDTDVAWRQRHISGCTTRRRRPPYCMFCF